MFDQELIDDLKTIIKSCYDKSIANIEGDNNIIVNYLISAAVIRSLIYCLENNKIEKFETVLQFDIKRSIDELEERMK